MPPLSIAAAAKSSYSSRQSLSRRRTRCAARAGSETSVSFGHGCLSRLRCWASEGCARSRRCRAVALVRRDFSGLLEHCLRVVSAADELKNVREARKCEPLQEQEIGSSGDSDRLAAEPFGLVRPALRRADLRPDASEQRLRIGIFASCRLLGHSNQLVAFVGPAQYPDRLGEDPGDRRKPRQLADLP